MYLKFESFDDSLRFTPLSFRLAELELFSNVNYNTITTEPTVQNTIVRRTVRSKRTQESLKQGRDCA